MTERRFLSSRAPNSSATGSSQTLVQCRYCLKTAPSSSPNIFEPCLCYLPSKYIHGYCLETQLKSNLLGDDINPVCGKCKATMDIEWSSGRECRSCDQMGEGISENAACFSALVLFAMIGIAGIAVCIILLTASSSNQSTLQQTGEIAGLAVSGVLLLIAFILFICCFLIQKNIRIERIGNFKGLPIELKEGNQNQYRSKEITKSKSNQTHLYDKKEQPTAQMQIIPVRTSHDFSIHEESMIESKQGKPGPNMRKSKDNLSDLVFKEMDSQHAYYKKRKNKEYLSGSDETSEKERQFEFGQKIPPGEFVRKTMKKFAESDSESIRPNSSSMSQHSFKAKHIDMKQVGVDQHPQPLQINLRMRPSTVAQEEEEPAQIILKRKNG